MLVKEVIYTIKKIDSDHEQKVYGFPWSTCETVWGSQMCWYSPGSHVVVTNTETGKSQEFVK